MRHLAEKYCELVILMTPFELTYLFLQPFLPPLGALIRKRLYGIVKSFTYRTRILDVGGRKSHYTIGVRADITITDLPRRTETQTRLHLGINQPIADQIRARRSNIRGIVYDDMTRSSFKNCSFDCVVSVEVLEHVIDDILFINSVYRVLKPGGIFLITTPNGDVVENTNPDHVRHYTANHLTSLLTAQFDTVEIVPIIRGGIFYELGLKSWSLRKPLQTTLSILGNLICSMQPVQSFVRPESGARHLFALAMKADSERNR